MSLFCFCSPLTKEPKTAARLTSWRSSTGSILSLSPWTSMPTIVHSLVLALLSLLSAVDVGCNAAEAVFLFRCYLLPLGISNITEASFCSEVVVCAIVCWTTTSMLD